MKSAKQVITFVVLGVLAGAVSACGSSVPASPTATLAPTPLPQSTASPLPPTPTRTPTLIPTPTRTLTPTLTFTPTPTYKDMLLSAFSSALGKLKTYRVRIPEGGQVIDVILPDRIRDNAGPMVKIGPTLYMYNFAGEVRAAGVGTLPNMDRANIIWWRDLLAQSSQIVLLGPGTVEGTACIGYSTNLAVAQIAPPKDNGTPVVKTLAQLVKIWFATSDGFPRRIEMGAPTPATITFYDFNANIQPIDPLK